MGNSNSTVQSYAKASLAPFGHSFFEDEFSRSLRAACSRDGFCFVPMDMQRIEEHSRDFKRSLSGKGSVFFREDNQIINGDVSNYEILKQALPEGLRQDIVSLLEFACSTEPTFDFILQGLGQSQPMFHNQGGAALEQPVRIIGVSLQPLLRIRVLSLFVFGEKRSQGGFVPHQILRTLTSDIAAHCQNKSLQLHFSWAEGHDTQKYIRDNKSLIMGTWAGMMSEKHDRTTKCNEQMDEMNRDIAGATVWDLPIRDDVKGDVASFLRNSIFSGVKYRQAQVALSSATFLLLGFNHNTLLGNLFRIVEFLHSPDNLETLFEGFCLEVQIRAPRLCQHLSILLPGSGLLCLQPIFNSLLMRLFVDVMNMVDTVAIMQRILECRTVKDLTRVLVDEMSVMMQLMEEELLQCHSQARLQHLLFTYQQWNSTVELQTSELADHVRVFMQNLEDVADVWVPSVSQLAAMTDTAAKFQIVYFPDHDAVSVEQILPRSATVFWHKSGSVHVGFVAQPSFSLQGGVRFTPEECKLTKLKLKEKLNATQAQEILSCVPHDSNEAGLAEQALTYYEDLQRNSLVGAGDVPESTGLSNEVMVALRALFDKSRDRSTPSIRWFMKTANGNRYYRQSVAPDVLIAFSMLSICSVAQRSPEMLFWFFHIRLDGNPFEFLRSLLGKNLEKVAVVDNFSPATCYKALIEHDNLLGLDWTTQDQFTNALGSMPVEGRQFVFRSLSLQAHDNPSLRGEIAHMVKRRKTDPRNLFGTKRAISKTRIDSLAQLLFDLTSKQEWKARIIETLRMAASINCSEAELRSWDHEFALGDSPAFIVVDHPEGTAQELQSQQALLQSIAAALQAKSHATSPEYPKDKVYEGSLGSFLTDYDGTDALKSYWGRDEDVAVGVDNLLTLVLPGGFGLALVEAGVFTECDCPFRSLEGVEHAQYLEVILRDDPEPPMAEHNREIVDILARQKANADSAIRHAFADVTNTKQSLHTKIYIESSNASDLALAVHSFQDEVRKLGAQITCEIAEDTGFGLVFSSLLFRRSRKRDADRSELSPQKLPKVETTSSSK